MNIAKTLEKINTCYGPSGQEAQVAKMLAEMAKPYCDEVKIDPLGNVICHKKGPGKKILMVAHMDTIGLMVTHIEESGYLRLTAIGGHSPYRLIAHRVRFANGTKGVVCCNEKAMRNVMNKPITMNDMYIDIGAKDAAEAAKYVSIGDVALYDEPCVEILDHKIMSAYTDDRLGCVALLMAMQQIKTAKNDLYFAFLVQEELGLRGATVVGYSVAPDYCIAVDCTVGDDAAETCHNATALLGKGAAIKAKDSSIVSDPRVNAILIKLAKAKKIPYQIDIIAAGGQDAGAIQLTRGGVPSTAISYPIRNVHSSAEIADTRDIEACADLTAAFAQYEFK